MRLEKDKLKKEHLRRLRLALDTDLSAKNKILATGSLTIPVHRYILELLTGTKNCKYWIGKQGNCKPSMDSITQRQMYITCCSQKTGRKGADAARRSLVMDYVDRNEDPLI
jgi:hypothetical protein